MSRMFHKATAFNQPLHFDTSRVASMELMFFQACEFNESLNFDTSSVTTMDYMFGMLYDGTINSRFACEDRHIFNQLLNFTDTL